MNQLQARIIQPWAQLITSRSSLKEVVDDLQRFTIRGRPGFDVGCKAVQGIPRISYLVNTTEKSIVANDETYALAA